MFSVASQLASQKSKETQHDTIVLKPSSQPSFPPGSQLLSLGRYLVNLSASDGVEHPCLDTHTGQQLDCRIYNLEDFQSLAPVFFSECEGVHRPIHVCVLESKVFVIGSRTYGDLHNYLKKHKKLSEVQAAPIFRQILTLVRDAHRKNIALRDLKLKNFVFEDPQRSILSLHYLDDAKLLDSSGQLTDRHGCPAYVCPEMLQPGSYSGKAADMWSLGIILYTLLVGHYPFFDTNPQTLFSKIRSGYYDIPDHISYLARSLISSLLAFEPHRRASPDAVLRHPWFSRTPDESFITPPPSVLDKDQTVPLKIY